jgi:hypothetical protein
MKSPDLIKFKEVIDSTGSLVVVQNDLPFDINRVFWIFDVEEGGVRGNHANISTQKVVICIKGWVEVELESPDGVKSNYVLQNKDEGLLIPSLYWNKIKFHDKAVIICIASGNYNEQDYIKDYEVFKRGK